VAAIDFLLGLALTLQHEIGEGGSGRDGNRAHCGVSHDQRQGRNRGRGDQRGRVGRAAFFGDEALAPLLCRPGGEPDDEREDQRDARNDQRRVDRADPIGQRDVRRDQKEDDGNDPEQRRDGERNGTGPQPVDQAIQLDAQQRRQPRERP
jgi:hypothetical protein